MWTPLLMEQVWEFHWKLRVRSTRSVSTRNTCCNFPMHNAPIGIKTTLIPYRYLFQHLHCISKLKIIRFQSLTTDKNLKKRGNHYERWYLNFLLSRWLFKSLFRFIYFYAVIKFRIINKIKFWWASTFVFISLVHWSMEMSIYKTQFFFSTCELWLTLFQ